jgi:hypothetical protein
MHRTGTHEYMFREGLAMNPLREDGRRCLDPDEFEGLELRETRMGVERWGVVVSEKQLAGIARMRLGAATKAQDVTKPVAA